MKRYRIDYLAYPTPRLDKEKFFTPMLEEKRLHVPWFWLAHLIVQVMKNSWEQGGKVVDTATGETRITWELAGVVFGDGKVHINVLGR